MLNLHILVDGRLFSPDTGDWINHMALKINESLFLTDSEFEDIKDIILGEIISDIWNAKDFEGNALLSLMPSTIAKKGHSRILIDSFDLLNSITADKTGKMEYTIYPGVDYASYLQFGTSKMVARPFFGYTPTADSLIDQMLSHNGYKMAA